MIELNPNNSRQVYLKKTVSSNKKCHKHCLIKNTDSKKVFELSNLFEYTNFLRKEEH